MNHRKWEGDGRGGQQELNVRAAESPVPLLTSCQEWVHARDKTVNFARKGRLREGEDTCVPDLKFHLLARFLGARLVRYVYSEVLGGKGHTYSGLGALLESVICKAGHNVGFANTRIAHDDNWPDPRTVQNEEEGNIRWMGRKER